MPNYKCLFRLTFELLETINNKLSLFLFQNPRRFSVQPVAKNTILRGI